MSSGPLADRLVGQRRNEEEQMMIGFPRDAEFSRRLQCLGPEGREFESLHSDHRHLHVKIGEIDAR